MDEQEALRAFDPQLTRAEEPGVVEAQLRVLQSSLDDQVFVPDDPEEFLSSAFFCTPLAHCVVGAGFGNCGTTKTEGKVIHAR